MRDLEALLPTVFGALDLRQHGVGRSATRHRLAERHWVRVSHGLFAVADSWATTAHGERLAASGLAQQRNYHRDKALSHLSAAAVHGLALPRDAGRATWMTVQEGGNRPRRTGSVIIERAALKARDVMAPPDAVTACPAGYVGAVTSLARTVSDCARHLSVPDAVAIADSAARLYPRIQSQLPEVLGRQQTWPGARRARTTYRLLDARRETWLESYSVAALHLAGVPVPEPQVRLYDARGVFVARVDLLWHEWGVVGEADGFAKYAEGRTIDDAVRSVVAEKVREDRIRDLGLEVVRWTALDIIHSLPSVIHRLDAARRRGAASRFSGTAASTAA